MSLSADYDQAVALHHAGKLQEAERLYRAMLQENPQHADAWHMLGLIAHQVGQSEPALDCVRNAIAIAPQTPSYYHNYALILHKLERHEEAAAALERLLALKPADIEIHRVLVNLRSQMGQPEGLGLALRGLANALSAAEEHEEAIQVYRRAIELRPRDIEILNNLGVVYMEQGLIESAITCYEQAVAIRPQLAELHNNLGNALCKRGRIDDAAREYRQALTCKPNYPKCSNNLAVMLIEAGRFDEAVAALREALNFRPDIPELLCNLGVAHKNLGQIEDAMHAYRRALTLDAQFVDAHHNVANLFLDCGLLDKAELAYRTAITLQPDDVEFHRHLALTYKRQANTAGARQALAEALRLDPQQPLVELRAATLCPMVFADAAHMQAERAQLDAAVTRFQQQPLRVGRMELMHSHAEPPFHAQFFAGNLRPFREAYAGLFTHLFKTERPARNSGKPRVGFVVTKGHEGVFLKSLRGVLSRLDRERFEVVVFASAVAVPRIRREITAPLQAIALPERADRIVTTIGDAKLDILYHWEVGTDSVNYFLPMFQLAARQCTSWGLQQTSGMAAMDFYLSSALVEPENAAEHYREPLLLADTLLTYQYRPTSSPATKSRADFDLNDKAHVYTCAQHLGKFHPDFDATLAEILRRDDQATLVITQDRFNIGAESLRLRFATTLGDVAARVRWFPRLSEQDYRDLLAASDVLLDPPHFGGVNSTYDGLALGKPIVTCPSGYQRGRYTLGCYRKMNVLDCVARDVAHYVQLAVKLGSDADYRAALAQRLAQASDTLWEDDGAVHAHERLFERMLATDTSL